MAQDRESQIRERAHAIWLEEGMPEGQAEQHWSRAETAHDTEAATVTSAPDAGETTQTFDAVPEFQNPEPAPVPPEVEVPPVASSTAAPEAAPATAKKPARRKVKPVTPIR